MEKDLGVIPLPLGKVKEKVQKPEQGQTLEDFEQEAYQKVVKKKGLDAAPKKKPAAAKAVAKAAATGVKKCSPKQKAQAKKPGCAKKVEAPKTVAKKDPKSPRKLTCWGCTRCRGNVHGCDSCATHAFGGLRLNGRKAWENYMQSKKRKGK